MQSDLCGKSDKVKFSELYVYMLEKITMKAYRYITVAALLAAASLVVMTGCEYDAAQPLWYQDYTEPPSPQITKIEPDTVAKAGVNTITILGENFATGTGTNIVYFGTATADIFESSATSIKVYRPNLATDSCTVKVVSSTAFLVAKYPKKYRIDPVVEEYGGFRDNLALSVIAVDAAENLYVVESGSRNTYKITPDGQKTILGRTTRAPTDAKIGPGGKLYLPGNNRSIDMMDLVSGVASTWIQLPAGKVVRFGDFDANGYFYTGGTRTDLMIVAPDLTTRAAGFYLTTEIVAVRVYNGYVYVATRSSATAPAVIWRHALDASGNVGAQEWVLDMNATEFASRTLRAITFSANGAMYLATDSPDPILLVEPTTQKVEIFYKGILSPYCKHFYWGSGTNIYMISGDTNLGQVWTVFKFDAGTKGAPYYGG
jgi:hypothetical protein